MTYGVRKTPGSPFGAEGVLTYYITDIGKTLAVMFSVPFNYAKYKNRVDVMLYEGKQAADENLWKRMYYDDATCKYQGSPQYYIKDLEPDHVQAGMRAKFTMSTSGEAAIAMEILPRRNLQLPEIGVINKKI